MSVAETIHFDKSGEPVRSPLFRKIFLALVIILTASLSFGIGQLSVTDNRGPVTVEFDSTLNQVPLGAVTNAVQSAAAINALTPTSEGSATPAPRSTNEVVVSKNGARYHYLHCSGAKQIKEENKIYFSTPQAAEAAGFTLAANCRPR